MDQKTVLAVYKAAQQLRAVRDPVKETREFLRKEFGASDQLISCALEVGFYQSISCFACRVSFIIACCEEEHRMAIKEAAVSRTDFEAKEFAERWLRFVDQVKWGICDASWRTAGIHTCIQNQKERLHEQP